MVILAFDGPPRTLASRTNLDQKISPWWWQAQNSETGTLHSTENFGQSFCGGPVADLYSKILDASPSPLGAQILSISCSFWENLAKSYVGAPPPGSWRPLLGEILDSPLWSYLVNQFKSQ